MGSRARKTPSGEDGFIIIEVLVSALILAIVAGAVLTLIATTSHSAAATRNHSTAYGLAQGDQARLRTLPISALKILGAGKVVSEPKVNGTQFKVVSKAFFVNDKSQTASCTEQNASTDYVEITSTVSSTAMPNAVALQSIISPSSGSIDSTHGSLVFQANNAVGEGVSKVAITASGPTTVSGETEATGCATFADIPSGNYKVTATAGGLITPEGSSTFVKEQVGAPNGGTQQVPIYFDRAGIVTPTFKYLEPKTGLLTLAPMDTMELFNSENGSKTLTFGTQNLTTRSSTLTDESVYPFKTKYAVYAGSCTANNPDPEGKELNGEAIAKLAVTGGGTSIATIRVPALNLTVNTSSGTAVKGAKVILSDANCSGVKREYTTNEIGHIVNSLSEVATKTTEAVGLPFGTYNICVSATISGQTRRVEATGASAVIVKNLTTAAAKTLALPSSGSSSSCS